MKFVPIKIKKIILQWFNYNTISPNFRKICHLIEKEKCLMQNAVTVGMTAKYHSSQKKTDPFIVTNVSKSINQHNVVAAMVEDQVAAMVEDQVAAMVDVMTDQEKCLMQNVATVEMIAKYHSNQKKTDPFIVTNVSEIIDETSKLF